MQKFTKVNLENFSGILKNLKEIPEPPKSLYIEGSLPNEDFNFITIVGGRRHSSYGEDACKKIIGGLSGTNIVIVSGLAIGIDTIAHKEAVANGLKTIAIPGSGLSKEILYPSTNRALAEKIISSGGCLISEYEPLFKATTWSFPRRNRLMAGLTNATLVIEAEEKSGTLITSRLALDYNKEVMAVPGSIFSPYQKGTNNLIRNGATVVTEAKDVLKFFKIDKKDELGDKNNLISKDLTENEKIIISFLIDGPKEKDFILEESKLSITDTLIAISTLEMKNLIMEELGEIRIAI